MSIRMRGAAELATKYKTRAGAATNDYKSGVEGAGQDWETNAANSESAFEQGVTEAIGKKRFGKGIRKAGGAHYAKRAAELGSTRYQAGVNAGADRWAQNTAPYLQALAGMTLPPPGPRRSPQNMARAQFTAETLGKLRDSL